MPGDAFIEAPADSMTHAITIRRLRQEVWLWLARVGAGARTNTSAPYDVVTFETNRFLVLERHVTGSADRLETRAFALAELPSGATRVVVRTRVNRRDTLRGLPDWIALPLSRLLHAIAERKQLLEIAARAESSGIEIAPVPRHRQSAA